ncbi:MAG: DUF3575 domain-containing protein [Endomicrobia bacterium]|nr:DUF3575 domain-containing protein [Endomicrobiia bacterium]
MKRIIPLVMCFLVSNLFAIEEKLEKIYGKEENAIYVNIVPFIVSHINVNYERVISNKISLMFGLGAMNGFYEMSFSDEWSVITVLYKIGVGIYPAGRFGNTLRGVYFMPSYTGAIINLRYKPEDLSGSVFAALIGVDIGHKWIWQNGLMIDLSVGMGFATDVVAKVGDKKAAEKEMKIGPTHIGVQFGYAW